MRAGGHADVEASTHATVRSSTWVFVETRAKTDERSHRAFTMSLADKVLSILANIADTTEVQANPNLQLFDLGVLDSLKAVELMVALSEEFGVDISPAEFERDQWATPKRIVAYMERRLGA